MEGIRFELTSTRTTSIGWFQHPSAPPRAEAATRSRVERRSPVGIPRALRIEFSAKRANPILRERARPLARQIHRALRRASRTRLTEIPSWSFVAKRPR